MLLLYEFQYCRAEYFMFYNFEVELSCLCATLTLKVLCASCLFICFQSHEQFFSYLAIVTIAGDRAAFYMPHLLRHGTSVLKVISERPTILPSEIRALDEGAITTYFKRLRFDAAGPNGARTHDLPFAKREHYH
jgi:hypothetical protein